jgi:hypothetical protein
MVFVYVHTYTNTLTGSFGFLKVHDEDTLRVFRRGCVDSSNNNKTSIGFLDMVLGMAHDKGMKSEDVITQWAWGRVRSILYRP